MPLQVLLGPSLDMTESMRLLSENPVIDEAFVRTHSDFCWDREALARNSGFQTGIQKCPTLLQIDWKEVASTPEIDWDMRRLSREASVSVRDVQRFPLLGWDFGELSRNPCLTWEHVKAFPETSWDYERLLRNPMSVWKQEWLQQHKQKGRKSLCNWIYSLCGEQFQKYWNHKKL